MMKRKFQKDLQRNVERSVIRTGVFTEQDIKFLPEPVQNHIKAVGLIGKPIMSKTLLQAPSASLFQSKKSKPIKLDFNLHLFGYKPIRMVYMKSSMFGIPFEAVDSFQDGEGFMKGVIGKVFTLFNQTGADMSKAQLLTYLGESLLVPSVIFNEHITWETLDTNHVKATITYGELSGSGVFTFDDSGFFQSFRTNERAKIDTNGSVSFPEWSVVFGDWIKDKNDIYLPSNINAIWHEADGDLVYFQPTNGIDVVFNY